MDETEVAVIEREPSEDDSHTIYILDTDQDKWTVGGTVRAKGLKEIWSMCFGRLWNSSSCLVLCSDLEPMRSGCQNSRWAGPVEVW